MIGLTRIPVGRRRGGWETRGWVIDPPNRIGEVARHRRLHERRDVRRIGGLEQVDLAGEWWIQSPVIAAKEGKRLLGNHIAIHRRRRKVEQYRVLGIGHPVSPT